MTRTLRQASRWTSWSCWAPTLLLKAEHRPKDFDRRLVIELWLYHDGSRIMEISTKCLPEEAFQFGTEFKTYLAGHGIALGKDQSAKTRATLEFFSAQAQAGEAGRLSDLEGGRDAQFRTRQGHVRPG